MSFASKLESALYDLLCLMEKAGEITNIKCQDHVYLTDARIQMIPDFRAYDIKLNTVVYYEAKGFETAVWRIKRKLWAYYGPGPLRIYMGSHKRLYLAEELLPPT